MARSELNELDAKHIWHPYSQHTARDRVTAITRASGAYVYDADDRAIFDAISSWWVTLHGHAHPVIAAAISDQASRLEQVIFSGFTHEPAVRLAAALLAVAPPGLTRVFYSDNGSTAVEVAVKMALQYWRNASAARTLVVALEHAYHGDTFGSMSVSARGLFTAPFSELLFEVARLPDPSVGDPAAAFAALLDARGRDVAAIIVEPMLLGAGGMRVWPAEMLAALARLARQHDVLFIADEVLTGFGRTGPLFACTHAGVEPDILCASKGITGGFIPLGATLASERIFEGFRSVDGARMLFHGHSYAANPLACAAGVASLALLDDRCAQQRAVIEREHRAAATRFAALPRVRNARVLGTMFAFEIDAQGGYLDPIARELRAFALERGVLIRPLGNTVYFLPPYCTIAADLATAYDVVAEFLERR